MDSPGGSPPRRGWETLDDDPLGEIARRSDVLTAARIGASCTNFFKTLLKQAWEKAMLVGLPYILEEKVLLWDNPSNSPPLPGHGCTLTPLELPTLRGVGFCLMSRSVTEFDHVVLSYSISIP